MSRTLGVDWGRAWNNIGDMFSGTSYIPNNGFDRTSNSVTSRFLPELDVLGANGTTTKSMVDVNYPYAPDYMGPQTDSSVMPVNNALGNSWDGFKNTLSGAFDNFFDKTDLKTNTKTQGWGLPALGAANAMAQSWLGLKQLGLAKNAMNEQRRQFDMNYDAQRLAYNNGLAERQAHKISANPNAEDVATYMAKWGVA